VLSCRYVDEVIIGAPWSVTHDMIRDMRIAVVARGNTVEHDDGASTKAALMLMLMMTPPCLSCSCVLALTHTSAVDAPYADAAAKGILVTVDSGSTLTTNAIIDRIIANRMLFQARNDKKNKRELAMLSK